MSLTRTQRCTIIVAYLCVGTVVAQLLIMVWLWMSGLVSQPKLVRMLAVMHEIDWPDSHPIQAARIAGFSYDDVERLRSVKLLHLEHKKQSLQHHFRQFWQQHQQLLEARREQENLHQALQLSMAQLRGQFEASDRSGGRLWAQISPYQVKGHILKMASDGKLDAAALRLATLPVAAQARILKTFTAAGEQHVLHALLAKLQSREPQRRLLEMLEDRLEETADPSDQPQRED